MALSLPDLPYDYAALEPTIDEQTMRIHHDKHHQAYVDNANKALDGTEWADSDAEEILRSLDSLPEGIRAAVRALDDVLERLAGVGRAFDQLVEVGDVRLVVLGVVVRERLGRDVRRQGRIRVGQGGQLDGHGVLVG